MFESLVNSSSGKTAEEYLRADLQFESLVNSSSGKTVKPTEPDRAGLRALLIQVVVKRITEML